MNLLECSGPIDRNAMQVVKSAHIDDVYLPAPNENLAKLRKFSEVRPEVVMPPKTARQMVAYIGQRRSRMVIVGMAKEKNKSGNPGSWVVRCDCGCYEVRSRIIRWLTTDAPDMCAQCIARGYMKNHQDQKSAIPLTVQAAIAGVSQNDLRIGSYDPRPSRSR